MRKILIDTHVLLWWLSDDDSLGKVSRELMANPRNMIFVSSVTSWEIAIKKKKGLLVAPDNIDGVVEDEGFSKLPISLFHGEQAGSLEEIRLWQVADGTLLDTLWRHTGIVTNLAFSPDGKNLISGSKDAICLWTIQE